MTDDTFNKIEFDANWAEGEKASKYILAVRNKNLYRRCIASYYRTGGTDLHDTSRIGHFIIERNPNAELTDFLSYISLSNSSGMIIAVYRHTNRGELKRLRRWPKSIDDGTAQTYAEFDKWLDECKRAIDEMHARDRVKRRLAADSSALAGGFSSLDMSELEATMAELGGISIETSAPFIR